MSATTTLVAYCRAGFEAECAADLGAVAARANTPIRIAAAANAGYVVASAASFDAHRWSEAVDAMPPVFARAVFAAGEPVALLSANAPATGGRADRVTPLLAAIDALDMPAGRWASAWIEFPDTNDGKELSTLARALGTRIEGELRGSGRLDDGATHRLHVFLLDGATGYVGTSERRYGSPWPMGIPRLRMPGDAPSRSTLKLAEAFSTFLGAREAALLRPGLRAVDLGAAPGGWTWQLAQRGLRVTAIDNGPLKGSVASNPLVSHLREDGLKWRPPRGVDWLVCDIVDQPLRVTDMVSRWVADGAARRAIFNLKLPMKRRYDEVLRCRARVDDILTRAGMDYTLQVRQLYHDREEVTAYLARRD